MTIAIRPMVTEDAAAVHVMGAGEPTFNISKDIVFWTQEQLKKWMMSGKDVLLVAEDQGEIVGFSLTMLHPETETAAWDKLFVRRDYRTTCIAIELAEETQRLLKEKGVLFTYGVGEIGTTRIPFFEVMGFEIESKKVWFGKRL